MGTLLNHVQIRALFPNEWILMQVLEKDKPENGVVLFHSKDYLELCYKGSEIAKDTLTTIFFTGENKSSNRKWLKAIRLSETPKTI